MVWALVALLGLIALLLIVATICYFLFASFSSPWCLRHKPTRKDRCSKKKPPPSTTTFNGSAAVGDFFSVTVNSANTTLQYQNLTTGQTGSTSYQLQNGIYVCDDPIVKLAVEIPGIGMVLQIANAGPSQDQSCLVFALVQNPVQLSTIPTGKFQYIQFRQHFGGVEIGYANIENLDIKHQMFWPFGQMQLDKSGQPPQPNSYPIQPEDTFHLGEFKSAFGGNALQFEDPSPESKGEIITLVAVPEGELIVDNPGFSMVLLPQADTPNFEPSFAGNYHGLLLRNSQVHTDPEDTEKEVGTLDFPVVDVTVSADAKVTVTDRKTSTVLFADTVVPISSQSDLYDPDDTTGHKLKDPCNGMFVARLNASPTTKTVNQPGSVKTTFFATFGAGYALLSMITYDSDPQSPWEYNYFYGAAAKN